MPLSRSHYLALAGVGLQLFKTLQRRDQIPLLGPKLAPIDAEDASKLADFHSFVENRGYLPIEAIMLAIADDLCTTSSFTRDVAKLRVQGSPELTINGTRRALAGEKIWIGFYATEERDGIVDEYERHHVPYHFSAVGTREQVLGQIDNDAEGWSDDVRSINLVNLTLIVKRAQVVRENLNITEPLLPETDQE
ncbi:hypothetical protein [Mesorhizobium sp. M0060]|uniref:hypothetical protein n=1 Tax=Mesorhizobium sp. M0060 TaxID=2956866 RepID=UPI003338F1A3